MVPVLFWGASTFGQGPAVSEYAVKSALLFKLPQFVYRRDASRERALHLCLFGSNPFGGALEKLATHPIDGREVRFFKLATLAEAGTCDFIFIARSEADSLDAILRRFAALPVVTVSDIDGFARAGGMVELAHGSEGAPVSILINRKSARRQNVEFNAQLLRLAKVVEP